MATFAHKAAARRFCTAARALFLGAFLLMASSSLGLAEQLLPGDTTDMAPKYSDFRAALQKAIAQRDAAFFRDRSLGWVDGTDTIFLDQQFNLDDPEDPFWTLVSRIVSMGGIWKDRPPKVVYPYVYGRFPVSYDPSSYAAVVGRKVNVREGPTPDSKVLGTLSYDIVELLDQGELWRKVKASEELSGYVNTEYLYGPADYKMSLENVRGRWMITAFSRGK